MRLYQRSTIVKVVLLLSTLISGCSREFRTYDKFTGAGAEIVEIYDDNTFSIGSGGVNIYRFQFVKTDSDIYAVKVNIITAPAATTNIIQI